MAAVGQEISFEKLFSRNTSNNGSMESWCCHQSSWMDVDKGIAVSLMKTTFCTLQEAALKTSLSAKIPISKNRNEIVLMLRIFERSLGIGYSGDLVAGMGGGSHALLCKKGHPPESVTLSWEPDNRYLHPKPQVTLSSTSLWGVRWRNIERKEGRGTDAVLKLGGHLFPVDSKTVESFSEWFRNGSKSAEGWTIDRPISKRLGEVLIDYMYLVPLMSR